MDSHGLWAELRALIAEPFISLSPDEAAFVGEWMRKQARTTAMLGFVLAILFHLVTLGVEPFVIKYPLNYRVAFVSHFVCLGIVVLAFLTDVLSPRARIFWAFPLMLVTIFPYYFMCYFDVQTNSPHVIKSWTVFKALSFFCILLNPWRGVVVWMVAFGFWLASLLAFQQHEFLPVLGVITGISYSAAVMTHGLNVSKGRMEGLREFHARRMLAARDRESQATDRAG